MSKVSLGAEKITENKNAGNKSSEELKIRSVFAVRIEIIARKIERFHCVGTENGRLENSEQSTCNFYLNFHFKL